MLFELGGQTHLKTVLCMNTCPLAQDQNKGWVNGDIVAIVLFEEFMFLSPGSA